MITLSQPLFARSGHASPQRVSAQEQDLTGRCVFEWAKVNRLCDRRYGRAGPGNGVGVRVAVEYPQLAPVSQVIGRGVDAHRSAEGAEP
jgi:hypothetical protein